MASARAVAVAHRRRRQLVYHGCALPACCSVRSVSLSVSLCRHRPATLPLRARLPPSLQNWSGRRPCSWLAARASTQRRACMRDESAASYAAPAPRQPTRAARRLRYECYGSTVDALAPCTHCCGSPSDLDRRDLLAALKTLEKRKVTNRGQTRRGGGGGGREGPHQTTNRSRAAPRPTRAVDHPPAAS